MSGKVLFTDSLDYEVKTILKLSDGYKRKFYVHGRQFKNIEEIKNKLSGFIFLEMDNTLDPANVVMFTDNSERDFFVLKYPRLNDIMDRNIDMHQTVLKGYKLIVEDHPFLGKRDIYWCYFLWSFFDKSLLGYPHCYAFQRAKTVNGVDPFDCIMLAKKVSSATETSLKEIFKEDIKINRIMIEDDLKSKYQEYKKFLFDTETSPIIVIRKLKKFVNGSVPILKKGFDLTYLFRVYDQYLSGERVLNVSDAKIDSYLESEFWKYINNVNTFIRTLWDVTRA